MSIDTIDDVTQVLSAARDAATGHDWPLAHGLLQELRESPLATDATWTEVRFLLGEACWALEDLESARRYYDEASVGAGEHAQPAKDRLDELDRLGEAKVAAGDGVSADEQTGIIAAADEAKARGDYDTAIGLYRRAYDVHDGDAMVAGWIAVDLGECHQKLHRYDEAKEWFDWAVISGDDSAKAKAQAGIDQLNALDAAQDMASDGTRATEIIPVYSAAEQAYGNGDDATAFELWSSLLPSAVLPADVRCAVLFNLAQIHIHRREYDDARARLEEARQHGSETKIRYIDERLAMLEQRDEALATAGLLPLE